MLKTKLEKQKKQFNDFIFNLTTKGFRELTAEELFTVNGGKRKSSSSSSSSSGNSGTKNTSSSAASTAVTAATSGASAGKNIGSNTGSDKGKANSNQNNDSKSTKNNTNSDSTKRESGWNQFIHGFLGIGNNDGNKPSGEKTTSSTDSYQESNNKTDTDCKKNTEAEKTKSFDSITDNQQQPKKTDINFNQVLTMEEQKSFTKLVDNLKTASEAMKPTYHNNFYFLPDNKSFNFQKNGFSSSITFDVKPSGSLGINNGFDISFKKEPNSIITTIVKTPVLTHSLTLNKITVEFQIKL